VTGSRAMQYIILPSLNGNMGGLSVLANKVLIWRLRRTANMIVIVFIFFVLKLMKQKYNGMKGWYSGFRLAAVGSR
jgi:hypothetical protein